MAPAGGAATARSSVPLRSGLTLTLALVATGAFGVRPAAAQDDDLPAPDSGFLVGTYDLRTSPDVSRHSFESTQILLPAGWPLHVTVAGKLRFAPAACTDRQPKGGTTEIGPAGLDEAGRPLAVSIGVGTETSPPGTTLDLEPHKATADTVTTFAVGPGVLWATRLSGPRPSCLSGTQTLTATVLPPPVIVFDRTRAVRGDTVNARLLVSWSKTLSVRQAWTWVNSAGTQGRVTFLSGCRAGDRTCRLVVHDSGFLRIPDVLVAGTVPQVAKSQVFQVGPARLTLTTPSNTVPSGSKVMFIAHRSDGQRAGIQSWVWKEQGAAPTLGPLAVDCASGDSVCVTWVENTSPLTAPVLQTGTMTAWILIDTWRDSATVALTVLPKTQEIPPKDRATMTLTVLPKARVTPPAATQPGDTVRLFMEALVDEKPVLVSAPRLTYPESLQRAGIEGRVIVQAIIDTLGRAEPATVKVVLSPNPGFDEPARSYVLKAVFRPARVHGRAVRVLVQVPVNFKSTGP